jgi:hypothetical protein
MYSYQGLGIVKTKHRYLWLAIVSCYQNWYHLAYGGSVDQQPCDAFILRYKAFHYRVCSGSRHGIKPIQSHAKPGISKSYSFCKMKSKTIHFNVPCIKIIIYCKFVHNTLTCSIQVLNLIYVAEAISVNQHTLQDIIYFMGTGGTAYHQSFNCTKIT